MGSSLKTDAFLGFFLPFFFNFFKLSLSFFRFYVFGFYYVPVLLTLPSTIFVMTIEF